MKIFISVSAKVSTENKKKLQGYAKEIFENIKAHFPAVKEANLQDAYVTNQLMSKINSIFNYMGYDDSNPNVAVNKKYFPKNYDATLINNGDKNSYDSVWYSMTDAQRNTIIRKAIQGK